MAAAQGRGAYKLNGAAPAANAARLGQPAMPLLERLLDEARRAQHSGSISRALAGLGATLVAAGSAWGLYCLVLAHAYLLCILLGLLILACSLALRPGGILACLPPEVQEFLLRRTMFDLLYDDTGFQNFVRRWGRMLLLCLGDFTAGEVRAITAGIDPAFVDTVMRRTFFWHLPAPVRALLVPSRPAGAAAVQGPGARLAEAAAAGVASVGLPADLGGPPLTPQRVVKLLKEKDQTRTQLITEPSLAPAIDAVVGVRPVLLRTAAALLQRAWGALSATSGGLCAIVALLGVPPVRELLLRGLSRSLTLCGSKRALESVAQSRVLATRAAKLCVALGTLSIGAAVAVAAASRRVARMREETPQKPAREAAASSAEDEEDALRKRVQALEAQLAYQQESHEAALETVAAQHRQSLEAAEQRRSELAAQLRQASPSSASASTAASHPAGVTVPEERPAAGPAGPVGGGEGPTSEEGLRRRSPPSVRA